MDSPHGLDRGPVGGDLLGGGAEPGAALVVGVVDDQQDLDLAPGQGAQGGVGALGGEPAGAAARAPA